MESISANEYQTPLHDYRSSQLTSTLKQGPVGWIDHKIIRTHAISNEDSKMVSKNSTDLDFIDSRNKNSNILLDMEQCNKSSLDENTITRFMEDYVELLAEDVGYNVQSILESTVCNKDLQKWFVIFVYIFWSVMRKCSIFNS